MAKLTKKYSSFNYPLFPSVLHEITSGITTFTTACHWSLFCANQIKPTVWHIYWGSILKLSSHMHEISNQNSEYVFHVSHLCFVLCSSHCPWFDHPNKFWGSQISEFIPAGYVISIKQVLDIFAYYCYILCYLKCDFVSILRWWGGAWTTFPHCIGSKLQFFFIFFYYNTTEIPSLSFM